VANHSETKSQISYCFTAKSQTIHMVMHEHNNPISSSLTRVQYPCSAAFIVNITNYQHDYDRTLEAIYCYACYLVEFLVIMWEPHETGQRATCSSRVAHLWSSFAIQDVASSVRQFGNCSTKTRSNWIKSQHFGYEQFAYIVDTLVF